MILDMASAYMLFSLIYDDDEELTQQQQQELVRRRNLQALTLLRIRNTIRTRNYLTTSALQDPKNSEWYKLYEKGDDGNFISVTGLNREGFRHLLRFFKRDYVILSEGNPNGGRPAKLRA
ncbi:hypothetical protein BKA69DRAFT_1172460 [Paraphysoderma sedebokerense]|nr:hypothetical protein BKA69DRAFT_1172460 [Paraphysoderma sedebokerense]